MNLCMQWVSRVLGAEHSREMLEWLRIGVGHLLTCRETTGPERHRGECLYCLWPVELTQAGTNKAGGSEGPHNLRYSCTVSQPPAEISDHWAFLWVLWCWYCRPVVIADGLCWDFGKASSTFQSMMTGGCCLENEKVMSVSLLVRKLGVYFEF